MRTKFRNMPLTCAKHEFVRTIQTMSETQTTTTEHLPHFELRHRMALALEHASVPKGTMADHLGISPNTVSNYLGGHTRPPVAALRVWALRCGVPYAWLKDGVETGPDQGGHASPWITRLAAA